MKFMRWLTLIAGIILIFFGFYTFTTPVANFVSLSIVLCVALLISGIFEIISYFSIDKRIRPAGMLIIGIFTTILGVWILFSDNGVASFMGALIIAFPIWLLVSSIMTAVDSISLKKWGISLWWVNMVIGIIGAITGFLLMFEPITSMLTISYAVAFAIIYRGVTDVAIFFVTRER